MFGAEHVVQIRDGEGVDAVAAARALTPEGRGADVVIEAVATPMTWEWAVADGAQGRGGEFFWRAAERDEGGAGYESAALWGHYAEGEFSSHAGDVQDGFRADYERAVQECRSDYGTGGVGGCAGDLCGDDEARGWEQGDQDGGVSEGA